MKHIQISDYSNKDYTSYWKDKERQYFNEVEKYVIDKLLPKKGRWFIDLGCGFGRFKELYLDRYENIVMLDFSEPLLKQAMTSVNYYKFPNVYFILADIYNLPFREHVFDASLMTRVFHHLQEPDLVIRQLRRILLHQGKMVFNFDNIRNLREIIKYLRKKTDLNPFRIDHLNIRKDDLLYYSHPLFVKKLLYSFQFNIVKEMGVGLFYGSLFSDTYHLAAIEKKLSQIMGKYFLSMLIFIKAVLQTKEAVEFRPPSPSAKLIDLLVCPDCKGAEIVQKQPTLLCLNCQRSFPIKERMFDLRIS